MSDSISGTATFYAGGGGAGIFTNAGTAGSGGSGIGGNGIAGAVGTAGSGAINTGSGGGGSGTSASVAGGGGSGIVIIAYSSSLKDLTSVGAGLTCNGSTGNNVSDTASRPGFKVYKFTAGTGSISW